MIARTMRLIRRVAAAVLLLLPAAVDAAEAQGEGGARIVGRVTDGAGNPVAGAAVVLVSADPSAPERTATSGETGGFELAPLAAGTYTVRVSSRHGTRELRVRVEAGERRTVIARLRPERETARLAERTARPRNRR